MEIKPIKLKNKAFHSHNISIKSFPAIDKQQDINQTEVMSLYLLLAKSLKDLKEEQGNSIFYSKKRINTSFEGGRKTLNNYQKTKSQTNIHSDAESVNFREFIPKNSKKLVKNPPTNTENISSYLKRNSIKFNSNARLDTRNFRTTMLNKEKNVINDLSFSVNFKKRFLSEFEQL